jgi:transposase
MSDWKLLDREQRGMVLAAMVKIVQRGQEWVVPSQTGDGTKYTVNPDEQSPNCTCPDFEMHGCTCKHIFAVRIVRQRELFDDGSETVTETVEVTETIKRTTYPQNWPAYNAAQTSEKHAFQALLHDLCSMIQEPPQHKGRPRLPLSDSIFSAVFKVYSTVSGRRFTCDLADAKERGHINRMPHYNSIFAVMEDEAVTPILKRMIEISALPMKAVETSFACDSSGFSGSRFDRWYDHKFGQHRIKRTWVKAHIMCGVKTNVITAVEIHGKDAGDCVQLPPMLAATAANFAVQEVTADLAYSTKANLSTIDAMGAVPLIPFKSHVTGTTGGVWSKMFHYFNLHREAFMARYHQRSNVETTFSMVKAKFGDSVRSKTDTAMRNECLCKFVCHNICCVIQEMHELGISPTFRAESAVAQKVTAI